MNILPKKRWHVRTKDNIARVRKDEAKAREEEKQRLDKEKLAEKEVRIKFLREKAEAQGKQKNTHHGAEQTPSFSSAAHVNLFADYEEGISKPEKVNQEHVKEKLEEQQKAEQQIGLLTFLGQNTNEALKLKSWYEIHPEDLSKSSVSEEKDAKIKSRDDPLNIMKAFMSKPKESPLSTKTYELSNRDEVPKHEHKFHKRIKKEKKKKKKKEKDRDKTKEADKRDKIERLRKARLEREKAERCRQDSLLQSKIKPVSVVVPESVEHKRYNNQFNPEFARRN